ncbi:MAG: type II toxin-antitoxin system Phd/YefM family antitoxin [Gemmatimonadota bacterium]
MKIVNTHEAKTHLSRLLKRVAAGEVIVIARAGKPVARLVPLEDGGHVRELGFVREGLRIGDDFDAPLPADVLRTFYGGGRS